MDEVRAIVEERLPNPGTEVTALVPYARGDLIDRIHREGEMVTVEHTGEGTLVVARVHNDLAGELSGFPA
jgi:GTP-binding protein HflX